MRTTARKIRYTKEEIDILTQGHTLYRALDSVVLDGKAHNWSMLLYYLDMNNPLDDNAIYDDDLHIYIRRDKYYGYGYKITYALREPNKRNNSHNEN